MKYVHIIINCSYTRPFMDFIERNFNFEEHVFYIIRGEKEDKTPIKEGENVRVINSWKNYSEFLKLIVDLNISKKIFFHGLFSPYQIALLFVQFWLLKKSHWHIWGGDLYLYEESRSSFLKRVMSIPREFVIKRLAYISSHIRGDYNIAKKWYKVRGKYVNLTYPSFIDFDNIDSILNDTTDTVDTNLVNIKLGNSAAESNNHYEILDYLSKYKKYNLKIYAILSYGPFDYAKDVEAYGKSIFGDKFIAIYEFMKPNDYVRFLEKMDIVVYNHKRQQGLGNLSMLIYLKKKIFINGDSVVYDYFNRENDIKVFKSKEISKMSFKEFSELEGDLLMKNMRQIKEISTDQYIASLWDEQFVY